MTTHWTESETKALISILGGEEMQQKVDGVVRNRNIYEKISQELSKVGINRSWKPCHDRIKNLLAKYRKTKVTIIRLEIIDTAAHITTK